MHTGSWALLNLDLDQIQDLQWVGIMASACFCQIDQMCEKDDSSHKFCPNCEMNFCDDRTLMITLIEAKDDMATYFTCDHIYWCNIKRQI